MVAQKWLLSWIIEQNLCDSVDPVNLEIYEKEVTFVFSTGHYFVKKTQDFQRVGIDEEKIVLFFGHFFFIKEGL